MRCLRALWAWITGLFRKKPRTWGTAVVDDVPERPRPATVYLVGEGDHLWFVVFLCPCGCGDSVQLNLLPDAKPRWSAERHSDGTVSVSPSVWRIAGCRSHFFLQRGRVEWC